MSRWTSSSRGACLYNFDTKLDRNVISACKSKSCQQVDITVLSCSMARVGHSGMTADELTENIEATVERVAAKIRMVSVVGQRAVFSFSWTSSVSTIGTDSIY